ncbi:MAG: biotin--[acetyl-CoA-carboxylase] ligase [Bacteroidales bacterium]|nr:biotin--[acetyl-CoA-carboxylase] ligase [Bacteroidales bacterium]
MNANYIFLDKTDSTNLQLKRLIQTETTPEFFYCATGFQSSGKGTGTNKWHSEKDKNALFSILLRPQSIELSNQFLISKIISLSILEFLNQHTNNVKIKWPNDIFVNDKKIAGILIEVETKGNYFEKVIAGVGLNLNQEKFPYGLTNAVSLKNICNTDFNIKQSINEIVEIIRNKFSNISNYFVEKTNKLYESNLFKINEISKFRDKDGDFNGKIIGVNEFGQLLIDCEDSVRTYSFKEVEYLF